MAALIMIRTFLLMLSLAGASLAADLRISAAVSLSGAVAEIAAAYQEENPGVKTQLNFAGSNALARQIEAGAPCDVFVSADEATLDALLKKGLLHENSVAQVVANSLVVIAPADTKLKISGAADLAAAPVRRLALGDPAAVPAGVYARKWLEARGVWEKLSPKVVATENVRAALSAVASGNADAGIVYSTDAMVSKDVVVIHEVAAGEVPPIIYPAAVTKSSADPGAGMRFIAWMRSAKGAEILRKHGFIPLPAEKK